MVCISLIISGIANLVVGISNHFSLIKYVWLLNGFSMSILWPSLIRLLSECLPKKDMTQATLAMGTTVATGTFLAYGLSALLVKINFKLVFNLAAAIFAVVAILWVSMYSGMVGKIRGNFIEEEIAVSQTQNSENKQGFNKLFLAMKLGYGVMFSSIPVFILQAIFALPAGVLAPYITESFIDQLTALGGVFMLCIGFNLLEIRKIKTANFLPALLGALVMFFI